MDIFALDWQPIFLSLKLAFVTTLVLLVISTPLAWWLARHRNWLKQTISILVSMPLVLPPTVLGFYLLILLSPQGWLGQLTNTLGIESLLFTFSGLVIGSVIYSLPFVVQPLQNAFQSLGNRPIEAAQSLGAKPLDTFFSVILPLSKHGFYTAAVLGFAHTLGEFGVVLMIGGSIPGETQVASVALFEQVEILNYGEAHKLAIVILIISFIMLFIANRFSQRAGIVADV